MYPPIFATCSVNAGVKAVFGTSPCRIYPYGQAPQGIAMPYAVWQGIGGSPENYINEAPDIDLFALQVDIYAATATAARVAAAALRNAIEPAAHVTRWGGESLDTITGHYRISFDVDWWTKR